MKSRVLVFALAVLCLFSCSTAMSLIGRARAVDARGRALWIAGAGFAAGCGIWATHFVAMLAYRSSFPFDYDIGLTLRHAEKIRAFEAERLLQKPWLAHTVV